MVYGVYDAFGKELDVVYSRRMRHGATKGTTSRFKALMVLFGGDNCLEHTVHDGRCLYTCIYIQTELGSSK